MNGIIYLVGLVVVILAVLSFSGCGDMVKPIEPAAPMGVFPRYLHWTPVILGALVATALSSICWPLVRRSGSAFRRPRRHGGTRPLHSGFVGPLSHYSGRTEFRSRRLSCGADQLRSGGFGQHRDRTSRRSARARCLGARRGSRRGAGGVAGKCDPDAIR